MVHGGVRRARHGDPPPCDGSGTKPATRSRGRHRQRREPGPRAVSLERLRGRYLPDPARGLPAPAPGDRGTTGSGRGRKSTLRRCHLRRSAGRSAVSTIIETTRRPCAKCAGSPSPAAPVVVADEVLGLHHAGLGHVLGVPAFDTWWLHKLGLDREFVDMVLGFDVDLDGLVRQTWPQARRHRIWHRMGYCFVDASLC